ncbi:NADPH quinone reductase or Zn-dependent oxidoreductase [Lunatimonas lonarensis]|uniref:NADPH quinone reductase or Zn-dependent oxidoreductase n=1 Tax=Lunatimonas lonarensis TaxID=1232681 RepID=R7ZUX6_9BACT|nr:zinc-dependent alcohol dehydrogenase family protein [Lunatimonas lonarensis]EON77945.1 NADPH quinone reductase or Zn-dependent oxidoreductase [Lunatimonas lonarensis]
MKKVFFYETGMPNDVLRVEEVAVPVPKEGEVLIRVTARNINPADIMFIRGMYGIQPVLPSPAGFEAAGVIEDARDCAKFKSGDRVLFSMVGAWAELVCLPAHFLIPVPPGMSDEVACQAFINPLTAYGMLDRAGLKAGDWLLLTAGASAFSKLVIQLAKLRGVRVICTVRREEQVAPLLRLGAAAVVNTEREKLQLRVQEITDKSGVSVVFDAVGGTLGARALTCLRPKGRMLVYGLLSLESIPLNSGLLIFRDLKVEGFWLTSYLEELDRGARETAFGEVLSLLQRGDVAVDVEQTFPLEQVHLALEAFEKPGRSGKILLV